MAISYTARENPANITASTGSIDAKTLAIMADMYLSLGKVTQDINQSNFDLAKTDYQAFMSLYNSNKDSIMRLYNSDPEAFSAINATDMTVANIQAYINSVGDYNQTYQLYTNDLANGDSTNATALAVTLDSRFRLLNKTYAGLRANSLKSIGALDNTNQKNVNSSLIKPFLNTADRIMASQAAREKNIPVHQSVYNLTLTAASDKAHVDDIVGYTMVLQRSSPVNGATVALYVDDMLVGSGVTDGAGTCQIPYKVSENLASDHVNVYAKYTSPVPTELPAISNMLDLHVLDENTSLSLSVSPPGVSFGDTINVSGRLVSVRGFPAQSAPVVVYMNGARIGAALTANDGTYRLSYRINEQTPGGQCNLSAVYDRAAGSFYLTSSSSPFTLEVIRQNTTNIMQAPGYGFNAGDMMLINGTLAAENGLPVEGAAIVAFMDDRQIGSGLTDINGSYQLNGVIPYDSSNGNHSLYTQYTPSNGSLYASSSNKIAIHVASVTTSIAVNGVPLILFLNDTLTVAGSMHTGDGKPVQQQAVGVKVSDSLGGIVTTDENGDFNYSRTVNAYDPAGIYPVSVFMQTSPGQVAPASAGAGYVIVLPIDRTLALAAFAIDIMLVLLAILIVRYGLTLSRLIDIATGRPKQEADLEDQIPVHSEENIPLKQQSFEELASGIDTLIATGDFRSASTCMYTAARSLARDHGVHIADSDTHREFYRGAAGSYPQVATPLGSIVNLYERMSYGRGDAGADDLKKSYDGLTEIYRAFTVAGATKK